MRTNRAIEVEARVRESQSQTQGVYFEVRATSSMSLSSPREGFSPSIKNHHKGAKTTMVYTRLGVHNSNFQSSAQEVAQSQ